jgi:hypothetical protein
MCVNIESKSNLHRFYGRQTLLFVALLFILLLFFSCFTSTFNGVSPFASGRSDKIVGNETELREAINNAPSKKSFTIALNNDITLTGSSLTIPANKNIILTSSKATGYCKLIGTAYATSQFVVGEYSVSTITVNGDGVLELDGVSVTHTCHYGGYVVTVDEHGQFIMRKGLISRGIGGVYTNGVFLMYGGEISGNVAMSGGGVFNRGVFKMFGGKILDNSAGNYGGGIYNEANGTFEMSGGVISGNTASEGGGIINYGGVVFIEYNFTDDRTQEVVGYNQYEGGFTLSGGVISGNTAYRGGGVGNNGVFIMSGGLISGNTAEKGGGVYNFFHSIVNLTSGGVISGNTAEMGGGVCIDDDFNMSGGVISGNTAQKGGGVYVGNGIFKSAGGKISDNTAPMSNDVYIENGAFESNSDQASNNVIICVCLAVVIAGVVATYLFLYFKKKDHNSKNKRLINVGEMNKI